MKSDGKSGRWLWVGVFVLFGLMAGAWTAMFVAASKTPVATVPLVRKAGS